MGSRVDRRLWWALWSDGRWLSKKLASYRQPLAEHHVDLSLALMLLVGCLVDSLGIRCPIDRVHHGVDNLLVFRRTELIGIVSH